MANFEVETVQRSFLCLAEPPSCVIGKTNGSRLLTVAEVTELYNLSASTIGLAIGEGDIEVVLNLWHPHNVLLIPEQSVLDFFNLLLTDAATEKIDESEYDIGFSILREGAGHKSNSTAAQHADF